MLETVVRRDIEINLSKALVNSIDNIEPNGMIKAMVEFNSKALVLGRKVKSLFQRELKEGNRSKIERRMAGGEEEVGYLEILVLGVREEAEGKDR